MMTEERPVGERDAPASTESSEAVADNRRKFFLVAGVVFLMIVAGIALFLVAVSGSGDEGPSGPGVYTDPSRTIKLQPGDQFSIELESNPSTGFNWVLTGQFSSSIVKMTGGSYRPPDPPVYGAPGTDVWNFQAVSPGNVKIKLGYMKQSVNPSEKADEKTFNVEVK